jgi:Ca2+/Na+ antiporter
MSTFKGWFTIPRRMGLFYFFLVATLEALAAMAYLFSIPADPKNSFIAGYSLPRLLVMAGMAGLFVVMALLAVMAFRNPQQVWRRIEPVLASKKKSYLTVFIFAALFLSGWVVTFTPSYKLGNYAAYVDRLCPVIIWLALFSLQAGTVILARSRTPGQAGWKGQLSSLRGWAITLGILLLVWGLIVITQLGLKPDPLYWNQPGVPLLSGQVLLAWLVGIILILVGYSRSRVSGWLSKIKANRLDLIIFVVIWLATAILWTHAPFPGSFFAPGPYPPNQQLYPFSDAAKYDTDAQYALIGLGMNDSAYTDKPLYSTFLILLHVLFGQRYDWIVITQIIVLAIFPALLYLLGKALHSRVAGILVAVLAVFQEINSISASQLLLSSNTHLLLSEVPTAVGLALFTYLMVRWLKEPQRRTVFPLLAGGVLGLCTLIRHNPWLLLVVVVGISFIVYGRSRKQWFQAGLLFALGMGLAIAPWMARSWYFNHTPFYFMKTLNGSFFSSRYYTVQDAQPTQVSPTPRPTSAPTRTPAPAQVTVTPRPTKTPRPLVAQIQEKVKDTTRKIPNTLDFTSAHFFHNIVASVVTLPVSLEMTDVQHIVASPSSFWSEDWTGSLTGGQAILLLLDIGLLALGIASSWKRLRYVSLMPLLVALIYFLSDGIARTSGGRYLVPAIWVIYFYFGLGLVQISQWVIGWITNLPELQKEEPYRSELTTPGPTAAWFLVLAAVLLFLIGATLPVTERVFPSVFVPLWSNTLRALVWLPQGSLEQAGLQTGGLGTFLKDQNTSVLVGRVLYPRFYRANKGEPDRLSPYATRPYARLVFDMIGPNMEEGVVLPMAKAPDAFAQGIDAVVLGCSTKTGVDALAVVVIHPEVKVYLRAPGVSLACPAPDPGQQNP